MSESWLNLEGKTVIVTGGASGIGKAVAQGFLNAGSNESFLIWHLKHQRWTKQQENYCM